MAVENEIMQYITNEEFFEDGDIIIKEGGYSTWAYVILEGRVKLKKNTVVGTATLTTIGEGAIFGELALFSENDEMARTASAVAVGPVVLGVLDSRRIVEDFSKLSPLMRKFFSTLIKRLTDTSNKLVSSVSQKCRNRLTVHPSM